MKTTEQKARAIKAWELRLSGMTLAAIAESLGVSIETARTDAAYGYRKDVKTRIFSRKPYAPWPETAEAAKRWPD